MALKPSTFILPIGSQAPAFQLPDPKTGDTVSFDDVKGEKGTLLVFACNHCPYVVHLGKELGDLAKEIGALGVKTVAISSNDVENYPQDGPSQMVEFAAASGWDFPYLYDASQEVAKAYSAACTPDFFLFDADGKLYYAGQFDDTRPNEGGAPNGESLQQACEKMLKGESYSEQMKPATGCNIKWKAGQEPSYF